MMLRYSSTPCFMPQATLFVLLSAQATMLINVLSSLFCLSVMESEMHVIFLYHSELRNISKCCQYSYAFRLSLLLAKANKHIVNNKNYIKIHR